MLPWCKDEREETVQAEYIKLLARMDSKSRSRATKHAIVAASSLLRGGRGSSSAKVDVKAQSESASSLEKGKRVAWHD